MEGARRRVRMRGGAQRGEEEGRGRGLGRGRGEGGDRGRGLGRGRGEGGDRGRGLGRGRGREELEELTEPEQRRRGPNLTQEIRATLIDHVLNHGLTLMEAGQRVQPNLSRNTVASVIRTFHRENRIEGRGHQGGRGPMFTRAQEAAIVNMVVANNCIRLREIQANIINNDRIFNNIHRVSLSTLARILKKKQVHMKQLYRVPFDRNSERVKHLRSEYVERVLQMDAEQIQHEFIYVDEAGFNLAKTRRRGRNVIGHRAITNVPGQRGGNITLCAAITQNGVLHHHANLGPYNANLILAFLDRLHEIVTALHKVDQMRYIVVWDNVSFHRAALVQNWFHGHPDFEVLYLLPYSPFLNPIEEFFSAWRWKVYDLRPYDRLPLIQAMEQACDQIDAASVQGWIRHSRRFFQRCLANEDIACDVDEILWPDPARRRDEE
ncbi:uncharacterized protein LOC125723169 isoform X9 [Brienomyrus brachyistius]|uniref:uncharacterized protein LOC125723169 isoform X9 n=1 Tax=Brienomyrus brachyistius TaxID=42636 RepID=UPI0020B44C59|nr:uncharacterized protein LOC125723169 isoform X9 [Brienomyrus brachyistius]